MELRIRDKLPAGLLSMLMKQQFVRRYMAIKYATSTKRLDICAAQIAGILHQAGFANKMPLRGKTCVEVGSGWVLSHSVIFHLLGAERIYSTDIERNAFPTTLRKSIHKSVSCIVRDLLGPFESHDRIRMRQRRLNQIQKFTLAKLREIGIYYWAPIDIARNRLNREVDFVFSNAVLEHVPTSDVIPLLKNLEKDLTPNGVMIHCIHLEDHKDTENGPFDFLSAPEETFTPKMQGIMGNRIRASEWMKIFDKIPNMSFRPIYTYMRRDRKLPTSIDSSITFENELDLRICNLGVIGIKTSDTSGNRSQ